MRVLLVGAGPMAVEYAKVLVAMNVPFLVVGNDLKSSLIFEEKVKIKPIPGGLEKYLENYPSENFTHVILATNAANLLPLTLLVSQKTFCKILVEKPAALSIEELLKFEEELTAFADRVWVAYNRRFYKAFHLSRKLIEEDGGLLSMSFEFTEQVDRISNRERRVDLLNNWFFANSTHVIDMAFALGGVPKEMDSKVKNGNLSWHTISQFVGSGITENGVLFSYHSNWESAGRWGIELMTNRRKIILRPLERAAIQMRNEFEILEIESDYSLDQNFKPGLYRQIDSFLGTGEGLCDIKSHIYNTKHHYIKILNGY